MFYENKLLYIAIWAEVALLLAFNGLSDFPELLIDGREVEGALYRTALPAEGVPPPQAAWAASPHLLDHPS